MSSARWCFTVNNPLGWTPVYQPEEMAYLVYENEVGEQGTPHVQGYVRFHGRKRMNTVKNIFERPDMHLEMAKGTERENKDYCSKDGAPVEHGTYDPEAGKQGRRSDLEAVADMVNHGIAIRDIALAHPADFIRYHGGIQALIAAAGPLPPLERDVRVTVLWGPTGAGKTHRIRMEYPAAYSVEPGRAPWDGYQGQTEVVFDEFDYSKWPVTMMNRFLDKWRLELDARYHNRYAAWTRVVILANSSPTRWYANEDAPLVEAFRRRLATVKWVGTRQIATELNLDSHEQEMDDPTIIDRYAAMIVHPL